MNVKIVVTGLSALNCLARDKDEFFSKLQSGETGLISNYPDDINADNIMQTGGFISVEHKHLGYRTTQLAVMGAKAAIADAGLPENNVVMGISLGTSIGGYEELEGYVRAMHSGKGYHAAQPYDICPSHTTSVLAGTFHAEGPLITNAAACAASSNAFGSAIQVMDSGMCDCMLVGGADPISFMSQCGFVAMKAMTKEFCRPFNEKNAPGIQIGEGAAFLILETYESAKRRDAKMYAEVAGYGCSNDAYHETAPDPKAGGAIRSMREALSDAGISAEEVNYINMHGTGTNLNDKMEFRALDALWGGNMEFLNISSIKGAVGHMLGCAGATEAVATVMALDKQVLLPNVLLEKPMNDAYPIVRNAWESYPIVYAMSNSFAFGGNASSVLFKKIDEAS